MCRALLSGTASRPKLRRGCASALGVSLRQSPSSRRAWRACDSPLVESSSVLGARACWFPSDKPLGALLAFGIYSVYNWPPFRSGKMTFICLWAPVPAPAPAIKAADPDPTPDNQLLRHLIPALLGVAPRVMLGGNGIVWADARGMSAQSLASDLLAVFRANGVEKVRAAISVTSICAEVAARYGRGGEGSLVTVPVGGEREYLARYPVGVLGPSPYLDTLLDGIGVETCADLARLELESVEVRFGAEG